MSFPIDKQAHFWWGWAIATTVYPSGVFVSIFLTIFLALAKELWDREGHGTCDFYDALATALGGIMGALVSFAIIKAST
ncbi:hypothetical protein UFOVP820_49 [uncultured Caudovirales phage]|uniref:Uncharacterized protein n=1 Tax=uncultured Caudovirales phage TaxID=2100421 RepID=A0A6J5P7P0_9CAUD|nr:hypothetical protein UFOVP820_49 [uncultured Caudovirales phage]